MRCLVYDALLQAGIQCNDDNNNCFPARDELGTYGTSLVCPKQCALRISVRFTDSNTV